LLSPLIIGTVQDLAYYPVSGAIHPEFKSTGPQTFEYLKRYLLIPTKSGRLVFISDAHQHAYFAWQLAKAINLVSNPCALVHIDSHKDNFFPIKHNSRWPKGVPRPKSYRHWSLQDHARIAQEWLDAHDFLSFDERLVRSVAYVLPDHAGDDTDLSFPGREMRTRGGQLLSMENAKKYISEQRAAGYDILADIDLDYFMPYFPGSYLIDESTATSPSPMPLEGNLRLVIEAARQADFITLATSPDWFLPQQTIVKDLIRKIVAEL
jgi:hypothetical protein